LRRLLRSTTFGRISWNTIPTDTTIRRKLQDRMIDAKRIQDAIEERHGKIGSVYDLYQAEALYYGRAGERLNRLRQKVLEPLVAEMRQRNVTAAELDQYLYARHAPE